MDFKKIDIKTLAIVVLAVGLIISFFFGQKSNINKYEDEIKALHKENKDLLYSNDSIINVNKGLDIAISHINKKLEFNATALANTELELNKLKNKKNEIPTYVKHLSADGVSNAFSDYLTKNKNAH